MINPKISIVIPVHKIELFIAECIQSVMRQTYAGPIECIVVDDCGLDKSIEIVEHLIDGYKGPVEFKIVHHEHNRGVAASRNTGINAATGAYLMFIDSDDYISDDCLEVLTQPLRDSDYDVVIGNVKTFGLQSDVCYLSQETGAVIGNENVFRKFFVERKVYVMVWNKLIKASLFRTFDLSFLEGQLAEDELWNYKLALCVKSMFVQNRTTYFYRLWEGSYMRSTQMLRKKKSDSCYDTIEYVLRHPASVRKAYYDKSVVYFFGNYLYYTCDGVVDFRKQYVELRKRFDYHPIRLFVKRQLSFSELLHKFHFVLPPSVGYLYLGLREKKNRRRG